MPDSVDISCAGAVALSAGLVDMQPAMAVSAVDETMKFLREMLFFMAPV